MMPASHRNPNRILKVKNTNKSENVLQDMNNLLPAIGSQRAAIIA